MLLARCNVDQLLSEEMTMIRYTRSIQANDGKAAGSLAVEIAKHIRGVHSQHRIEVLIDRLATNGTRIYWQVDFKNIAHWASWQWALARDDVYLALVGKAHETSAFVKNTKSDSFQSIIDQ